MVQVVRLPVKQPGWSWLVFPWRSESEVRRRLRSKIVRIQLLLDAYSLASCCFVSRNSMMDPIMRLISMVKSHLPIFDINIHTIFTIGRWEFDNIPKWNPLNPIYQNPDVPIHKLFFWHPMHDATPNPGGKPTYKPVLLAMGHHLVVIEIHVLLIEFYYCWLNTILDGFALNQTVEVLLTLDSPSILLLVNHSKPISDIVISKPNLQSHVNPHTMP